MVNTSSLSKFLKADHVKDDDIINFMTAGTIEFKEFKKDGKVETNPVLEMAVRVKGEDKIYTPNATTRGLLEKAWGNDTENWVGKQARITVIPGPNGKDMIVAKPI